MDSEIRGIAPRGMRNLADSLVLEKRSVAYARKVYAEALRQRCKSVGSPEPTIGDVKTRAAARLDSLSSEEFSSAFGRLGGYPG